MTKENMKNMINLQDFEQKDFSETIKSLKGLENYFQIKVHKNKWDKPIIELIRWLVDNTAMAFDMPFHAIDKAWILANVKDFRDLFLCFRDKEDKKLYFLRCKIKKIEILKLLSKMTDYYKLSHIKDNEFKCTFPEKPFCDTNTK